MRGIRLPNWSSHEPCRRSADLDWNARVGGEPVEQVAQAVGELLLGVVLSQPAGELRDHRRWARGLQAVGLSWYVPGQL